MKIRKLEEKDMSDFIRLARQLGYEVDESHLKKCIDRDDPSEIVFVGLVDSKMISWINCRISDSFLSNPYCNIIGFVVDEKYRSRGIGKEMLKAAENWATQKGFDQILVRSNVIRKRAHEFYLKNDFQILKQSMVFFKNLNA